MNKKIVTIFIAILLISIGLSGCNEKKPMERMKNQTIRNILMIQKNLLALGILQILFIGISNLRLHFFQINRLSLDPMEERIQLKIENWNYIGKIAKLFSRIIICF